MKAIIVISVLKGSRRKRKRGFSAARFTGCIQQQEQPEAERLVYQTEHSS